MRPWAILVATSVAIAAPAVGQTPDTGQTPATADFTPRSWASVVEGFDPAADDPGAWSELLATAMRSGRRSRVVAFVDSLVDAGAVGRTGLRYWGALELDRGRGLQRVVERYDRWLAAHPDDREAPDAFVTVLLAHMATDAAADLLERAEAHGADPGALALPRGAVRLERGDPAGAARAWGEAVELGVRADEAERRIVDLLARAEGPETVAGIREALEAAYDRADDEPRGRLAPLLARAYVDESRWEEAIETALDPALAPADRAGALRRVAGRAGERETWDAARRAIEAILEMGPPAARPTDRLVLVEIARRSGEPEAAARAGREAVRAGVPSARAEAVADEVAAARLEGDVERLAEAVERARVEEVPLRAIAVAAGDVALARGRADSALARYDAAIPDEGGRIGEAGLEALERQRLVLALLRSRVPGGLLARVGEALIEAPADPADAAARLEELAGGVDGETGGARPILLGIAAGWRGRAGEAERASAALEEAAREPAAGAEAPRLLLAAGSWARAAGDEARARTVWTEVATEHDDTPYALEARRLLASGPAESP